ncbi:MAG: hypothetical protein ACOVOR_02085 [Rhabdochlamydiaceae bacterium]
MSSMVQNFYEQNRITFFTLKDYDSLKTQIIPSIAYAATLICLSCIFNSSLKSPERISFLTNKAGLLLQESAKLGMINYLILTLGVAILVKSQKDSLPPTDHHFLSSCTNILITRLITNLALYSISFLLISKTSTLKLSSSLTRYSFLVLTHMLSSSFYIRTRMFSWLFLIKYMYIQDPRDIYECLESAIRDRNILWIKALIKHEKFDHNGEAFKTRLLDAYKDRTFSEQEQTEIDNALRERMPG